MQNYLAEVINKAFELLSKYPLCDSCLGRCFARLSYAHTNEERGKAIKLTLLLSLDYSLKEHKIQDSNQVKEIMFNMGQISYGIFSLYFGDDFQNRSCYICNNRIQEIKRKFYQKALSLLREKGYKTFVLGVSLPRHMRDIEQNFIVENGLIYYESLKNEIKREVGKLLTGEESKPDIDNPEVEIIYDIEYDTILERKRTKHYLFFYNRLVRGIPLSSWYAKGGLSLEKLLNTQINSPYSEPSDVRIVDDYPLITEVDLNLNQINGFYLKKSGRVSGTELDVIYNVKPSIRVYRVTVNAKEELRDCVKVFDTICDIFIEAKDFNELKQKLAELRGEILGIDLISTTGKSNLLANNYIRP
ncbi:pseudouridylate synthase [Sulfolobus acidocaldarius]|uniref:Conserved Archaeal protein n=4 Tax=Sulfolobus acidocaldarius TaxID=2285 RepID=Q4J983_SULAC|nr:pseudouridylate synthase [Sulfolobus acidocaldarius]AAY80647.1 conserved Archaeal protein [Sulfolobus acidocaldarius DSM 639]AGE71243.1 putative pseudouridylate synthase [Sulfolobus acidocaldarius N8]AGE73512.1 putative pseudouridylate synthase [Sulfolobus acidocaldarius Ron12/I]ALU30491.1 pseudouridylate synthase [Sulfolobus acidocaldarius]ALU31214.1 pseudouridylate synthase [Sulfolobus acidocaldarius]